MCWNVTGLHGKFWGNTHSSYHFLNYIKQFKIIGLTETWAKKTDNFDLDGFKSFSVVRSKTSEKGRYSGGILVYVSNIYSKFTKCLKSISCNILWILIQMSKMGSQYDLLIGTVYISPENSSSFSEEDTFSILENEILQFKEQLHNTEIIIMGDMNGYTKTENDFFN